MIRPGSTRHDPTAGVEAGAVPATPAVDAARRTLLEHLHRSGPVPPGEIPGRWPLTRHHVRIVLAELVRDGLVVSERSGGGLMPRLSLTASGHRALRNGG